MSNSRRSAHANSYRSGYLKSKQWFARRARWFTEHDTPVQNMIVCAGCRRLTDKRFLELHHVSYEGVEYRDGSWSAQEAHEDLWPMHPACHELLHRLIDRDPVLSRHRSRRDASTAAARIVLARFGVKEPSP